MKRELYENVFMNGAKVLQRHEERIVLWQYILLLGESSKTNYTLDEEACRYSMSISQNTEE
jgi:hypothetical protein